MPSLDRRSQRSHSTTRPQGPCLSQRPSSASSRRRLCITLVLALALLQNPPLHPHRRASTFCDAAPTLWSPILEAIENAVFMKHPNASAPAGSGSSDSGATPDVGNEEIAAAVVTPIESPLTSSNSNNSHYNNNMNGESQLGSDNSNGRAVPTAEDYGVIHLDLEGDPNCDYTTKIKIAGTEYNVIIDTGSAHFAVASSACHECVIPRKDHFRPNEEEEIPISNDDSNSNSSNSDHSWSAPNNTPGITGNSNANVDAEEVTDTLDDEDVDVNDLFNLYRGGGHHEPDSPRTLSTSDAAAVAAAAAATATRTPTTIAPIISSISQSSTTKAPTPTDIMGFSSTTATLPLSSSSLESTLFSTSALETGTRPLSIGSMTGTTRDTYHASSSSFSLLPSLPTTTLVSLSSSAQRRKSRRNRRTLELDESNMALLAKGHPLHSQQQQQHHHHHHHHHRHHHHRHQRRHDYSHARQSPDSKRSSKRSTTTFTVLKGGAGLSHPLRKGHERIMVAAPAENLYPLSESARMRGQIIRVSYGIKTHSVGWSGVMTSDLMAVEMGKVETDSHHFPLDGLQNITVNETMEKETSVEFAAITENNGFFSQECGAQHGIWGLAYRALSVDQKPTLLDTLSAAMKIPNGFALQLCGRTENTTKSGNLFLGGYSNEHLAEPMQYVPLIKKDWYQVQLDGFRVMGEPIQGMQNLNVPKTIVDSGTTNVLMSHYNLVYLVSALAQSKIIRWSSLISQEDIHNFWFRNAVLRLPRSSFEVVTEARALEVVLSGVKIPIYTSSFLKIRMVTPGQAPDGFVDFWWHGFASSTPPDMVDEEHANGGAVLPGSVGTILGETLFAGKVVYFERGNEEAALGDPDFGRIGFGRGKNCFLSARHGSVDVLASQGRLVSMPGMGIGPVRVASTSDARRSGAGSADQAGSPKVASSQTPTTAGPVAPTHTNGNTVFHLGGFGFGGPIRLMGSAEQGPLAHWGAMRRSLVLATLVVVLAGWL